MKRLIVILAMTVAAASIVSAVVVDQSSGSAANGAHWKPVSFTANAPFTGEPEVLIKSHFPGCAAGDGLVSTPTASESIGQMLVFTGSKVVTCSEGTFTFQYRAFSYAGAPNAWGSWMITGGTGDYEGVNGAGQVEGTYVYDASGITGIVDKWDGKIWLPE
jgi:hypothetical protein